MPPPLESTRQATARERALLLTLAGVQFTNIVDFMVMMPLGPQFTRLFGISDASFGLLVSAYTLAAATSGLAGALFVDRFERKALFLWIYAGFALATLLCALAPSYELLLAARVAAGLFGGVLSTLVQTMIGDVVPFERRGRAMGIVMTSFSLATVAGVPGSLWVAHALGWQAVFGLIAASSLVIGAAGLWTLPRLDTHRRTHTQSALLQPLRAVLREPNHWRAFGLAALMPASGFTIIPFVTIALTSRTGLDISDVPLMYLAGGVATFFTSRWVGIAADRWGKLRVLRVMSALAALAMIALTQAGPMPLPALLVVTTSFFVFVSGRMVPGSAIVSAASLPALRGTFMSLAGSLQSASMGLASLLGGMLIGRNAAGVVEGFERNGWVAALLAVVLIGWAGRVKTTANPTAVDRRP